jgi:hypothetical protein
MKETVYAQKTEEEWGVRLIVNLGSDTLIE